MHTQQSGATAISVKSGDTALFWSVYLFTISASNIMVSVLSCPVTSIHPRRNNPQDRTTWCPWETAFHLRSLPQLKKVCSESYPKPYISNRLSRRGPLLLICSFTRLVWFPFQPPTGDRPSHRLRGWVSETYALPLSWLEWTTGLYQTFVTFSVIRWPMYHFSLQTFRLIYHISVGSHPD